MNVSFPDGAPFWVDISAPNVPEAVEFYRRLFGWEAEDLGAESGHYTMLSQQGKQIGAAGPQVDPDDKPAWTIYFKVADARAIAEAVESAGGTVAMPPMDVFDQSTIAQFTDPTGARFAVSQPKAHTGAQLWGEPGSVTWVELDVRGEEPALGFYTKVFGWSAADPQLPNLPPYTMLTAPGADRPFGGAYVLDEHTPPDVPTQWMVSFEVSDCDTSAEQVIQSGGTIIMEPMTLDQVGRVAMVADPNRAQFVIMTSVYGGEP